MLFELFHEDVKKIPLILSNRTMISNRKYFITSLFFFSYREYHDVAFNNNEEEEVRRPPPPTEFIDLRE